MDELEKYYEELQQQIKVYLENELKKLKDEKNMYLSQALAYACENAKNLLEANNKNAFDRFEQSKNDLNKKRLENYPESLLKRLEEAIKRDLERSIKFNQSIFEILIASHKKTFGC